MELRALCPRNSDNDASSVAILRIHFSVFERHFVLSVQLRTGYLRPWHSAQCPGMVSSRASNLRGRGGSLTRRMGVKSFNADGNDYRILGRS